MRNNKVVFEFENEALAEGDGLGLNVGSRRKAREEEKHRERIVEISQCIDEGGIPLFHNVV